MALTHVVFGALCVSAYNAPLDPVVLTAGMLGSLLPDIDHAKSFLGRLTPLHRLLRHRGFSHSILGAVLLLVVLQRFVSYPVVLGVAIGYGSHVFLDTVTPKGCQLLWPSSKFFGIPLVPVGSWLEVILLLSVIILVLKGLI